MTNVTQKNTASVDFKEAYKQLVLILGELRKKDAHFFLDELLTETERIMLVKRFAAIFMFDRAYSTYRVSLALAISFSTAERIRKQYESGNFNNLLACISKKQKNNFTTILQEFILSKASGKARSRLIKRART